MNDNEKMVLIGDEFERELAFTYIDEYKHVYFIALASRDLLGIDRNSLTTSYKEFDEIIQELVKRDILINLDDDNFKINTDSKYYKEHYKELFMRLSGVIMDKFRIKVILNMSN